MSLFINFLFPSACLHCGEKLSKRYLLCPLCLNALHFETFEHRCLFCFSTLDDKGSVCWDCRIQRPYVHRTGAVFEHKGPAFSLLFSFQKQKREFLAKTLAALMVVWWETKMGKKREMVIFGKNSIAKEFASFTNWKYTHRKKQLHGKRILLITDHLSKRDKLDPFETLSIYHPQEIYVLAFTVGY